MLDPVTPAQLVESTSPSPHSMSPRDTAEYRVKQLGREAGFDLVRITSALPLQHEGRRYVEWVDSGRQAEMRWITREHASRCAEPRRVLPDARAVICVGLGYWSGPRQQNWLHGRVARYAWGDDYHQVLEGKLESFASQLEKEFGAEYRWHVDTGPLMDKALAARAGLGWYGKNTNILTEALGSFLFLGEIITTLDLTPDTPIGRDCGTCRLCTVACPTGAIGPDYALDAGKCISYLTIEHRGPIPHPLRPKIGSWVFGCDICQDVCPPAVRPYLQSADERRAWAREVRATVRQESDRDSRPAPSVPITVSTATPPGAHHRELDLVWLLRITHDEYLQAFRGTAIRRAKVWMLRRNAAVALGNTGDSRTVDPLLEAVQCDDHPIVRGHAAWAIGEIARREARPELAERLRTLLRNENDGMVRDEITRALASGAI